MKIGKFKEEWKNKELENQLLKFVILILTLGILVEGGFMIYLSKSSRTVIVPAHIDKKFYVEGDKASPEYIGLMSKYAVELISNYTPETARDRTEQFLMFINPKYYSQVSAQLLSVAEDAKSYSISQYFIPDKQEMKGNTIQISGIVRQFSQDKTMPQYRADYKLTFEVNNGRFEITSYEKVENKI